METFVIFVIVGATVCMPNAVSTSKVSEDFTSNIPPVSVRMRNSTAAEKWLAADKLLRDLASKTMKSLLSRALRGSENMNITSGCTSGLFKFMTGIKRTKLWAFRMLDSFGKIPNGILDGGINTLGAYDLCIETEIPGNSRGQYCILDVAPPLPPRERFVAYYKMIPEFINITPPDSVTTELLKLSRSFYRLRLRTSICVPSTCSKNDVQELASKAMELMGIEFDVAVTNCEVKVDKMTFGTSEIVIIVVLLILVLVAFTATAIDVTLKLRSGDDTGNLSLPVQYLLCFSFYTNLTRLLKKDESADSIRIFHGMKVITVLWVMFCHNYLYSHFQAMSGLSQIREKQNEMANQILYNGFMAVETFFFISAVLAAYGVMKLKQKRLNVFLYIFRRIWRLLPPYMFVIACIYLIPYLGSGPVWKETVVEELTEKCKEKWWTNLIFINNFVTYSDMCMKWSWYISVDTQLYIISLVVLIPLKSNPRRGLMINCALLLIGIITSAVMHVYYKLPPKIIAVHDHPDDIDYTTNNGYYRTYVHCSTYCVGLAVGYFLTKKPNIRIPTVLNVFGWIASFSLALSLIYGIYDWNQGNLPSSMISTLYGCTEKFVWALALAWVTIVCMTGHGGIATSILSWNPFVHLGRLTYMTYLIHPVIHFMYLGSTRALIYFDHRTMVYQYLGTVLMAYICAVPLSLLFESPFSAMEKLLLSSRRRPSGEDKDTIKANNETAGEENASYVISMQKINYVE